MTKLVNENGLTLEKPNEIMIEVSCFYETLHRPREVDNCEINDLLNEIQNCHKKNRQHLKEKRHSKKLGLH